MSTYYDLYLEANIDNEWHYVGQYTYNVKNNKYTITPLLSGQSSVGTFVSNIGKWGISADKLSKEIQTQRPYILEANYINCCYIPSEDIRSVINTSKQEFDAYGFFSKEDAQKIDLDEYNEYIYPIEEEEIIKLPEYVVKELYSYREFVRDNCDLYYSKLFADSIHAAIYNWNEMNYPKCVNIDNCRVVIIIG